MDLGISDRQLQRLEKRLHEVGALDWKDSGNHKRYGQRCSKTGRLLYGFGVDLSAILDLQPQLDELFEKKRAHDQSWMELKRRISAYRGQIRRKLQNAVSVATTNKQTMCFDILETQIRSYMSIDKLREISLAHKALIEKVMQTDYEEGRAEPSDPLPIEKTSAVTDTSDKNVVHNNTITHNYTNKLNRNASGIGYSRGADINSKGNIQSLSKSKIPITVTTDQILSVCSYNFKLHYSGASPTLSFDNLLEAAYKYSKSFGISQKSWAKACHTLGRKGALFLIVITDRAKHRQKRPINNAGAYFSSLVTKAERGELNLEKSIYGLFQKSFSATL
jgi:hypothetical protein